MHSIYGLRVDSEIDLPARAATDGRADLTIELAQPQSIQSEPPPGRVVVRRDGAAGLQAAHTQAPDGNFRLRFPGHAEFRIARDLDRIVACADPASPSGFHAVLLAGEVLSFYLCLQGRTVLHASAVGVDGRALALLGVSGQGKSSLSARLCARGAELISDDVLRVSDTDSGPVGFPGTTAIRLRPPADAIADSFASHSRRNTPDDRIAVYPQITDDRPLGLAAFAVPYPDRGINEPSVVRLPADEALQALIRYPRVLGWQDHAIAAHDFPMLASIARRLPVFAARIPWGERYLPRVADQLLESMVTGGRAVV